MIIATHQPYFFPYLGYFNLISSVDKFVFFDISQYTRRSWMTRNCILNRNFNETEYINIGIKKPPYKAMLPECKLTADKKWVKLLITKLGHYKNKAPYFDETMKIIDGLLSNKENKLVDFNVNSTKAIAKLLKINTSLIKLSEIENQIEAAPGGGYWGINICKGLCADTYVNAPGGEGFYPVEAYRKAGIKLGFIQHDLRPYAQNNSNFVPGLSIIDVLMFNGVKKTSEMVHDYSIKWVIN